MLYWAHTSAALFVSGLLPVRFARGRNDAVKEAWAIMFQ
jgi:hypothetical protein